MELEPEPHGDPLFSGEHIPVMLDSALALLNVRPGLTYVDATAGGGGHLTGILELTQGKGQVIGIDKDASAIARLKGKLSSPNLKLIGSDFANVTAALAKEGIGTVSGGIIADLGISSMQVDDPARGFSFLKDGPLDMRMNTNQTVTANDLVNKLSEKELADIIFKFGEERESRTIARNIVRARPLNTTSELKDVVAASLKYRAWQKNKIRAGRNRLDASHPATRTFQALRIAVNSELESLNQLLEQSRTLLSPGARLVVITFHSLEDRMVKQFFKRMASHCVCPPRQPVCTCQKKPEFLIITRKPFVAEEKEVLANVRSRSAKLRAGEKLP